MSLTGRKPTPEFQRLPARTEEAKRLASVLIPPKPKQTVQVDYRALELRILAQIQTKVQAQQDFDRRYRAREKLFDRILLILIVTGILITGVFYIFW